jgi:transposase
MRGRCTEERHDSVADEFLDRAAEALEVATHVLVVGGQTFAHVLWVHPLRLRRRPDEIAEQNRDDLSFLSSSGGVRQQGRAARPTESEVVRALLPAAGARQHTESL